MKKIAIYKIALAVTAICCFISLFFYLVEIVRIFQERYWLRKMISQELLRI